MEAFPTPEFAEFGVATMPQRLSLTSPARLLTRAACLLALTGVSPALQAAPATSATPAAASTAAAIGQVSFVVGAAQLQRAAATPDSAAIPLTRTTPLQQGDWIITGADGHVHLRMSDQGFIAVRPNSRLQLRAYHYAPQDAAANRVQLHLESGSARTISGAAGEANRRHYRFTTPIAAIGLRGTDYVVAAADNLTRVSVLKGAIVMDPLGPGCSADLASPCHTAWMRELAASPGAWLELQLKNGRPHIELHENASPGAAPLPGSRPHPDEPQARLEREALQTLQAAQGVSPSLPNVTPTPPPDAPPATIVWGRWQHVATPTPTLTSQLAPGREISYAHELFGLLGPGLLASLPRGQASLNLDAGEAWLKSGSALLPVALGQGRLELDFDQRQFSTQLNAHLPSGREQLQASGAISQQGQLSSDPTRSNMNVAGIINASGQEAGYLFDARRPDGQLYGATHWRR